MASVAPVLGAGLACAALVSLASLARARARAGNDAIAAGRHAVHAGQAVAFALVLTAAITAVNAARQHFGPSAVTIGAALTGLIDVHAAVASTLALAEGDLPGQLDASLIILIALAANTLSKLAAAYLSGGARFCARLAFGLLLMLAAAAAPYGAVLAARS